MALLAYLLALADAWDFAAWGGVVGLLAALLKRFTLKEPINRDLVVWPVVAAALVASATAWNREHDLVASLENKLSENTPRFRGLIDGDVISASATSEEYMNLYLRLSILGQGAPSVLVGFRVIATRPNGIKHQRLFEIPAVAITEKEPLDPSDEEASARLAATHQIGPHMDLLEKSTRPLQRGALARGWLKFPNVPNGGLRTGDTLSVVFFDYLERGHRIMTEVTGGEGVSCDAPQPICPGITQQVQ